MGPEEVDRLPIVDFILLVQNIEARLKSRETGLEKGNIWIA